MIENGFMNPRNLQGKVTLTRGALIRAAIGYCGIFVNTLSQISNWSPKAKELIKRGEEIIDKIMQGLDHESGEERGGSLMPNASPYELVIKIIIEEQIDKDLGPRDQLSEFTFNSQDNKISSANVPSLPGTLMENLRKLYSPMLLSEVIEHDGTPRTVAFRYKADATPQLAVATSPEKWWPGSFLMRWATISRQSRLGAEGQQAIKKLINAVDNRVMEEVARANLSSQKLGVRNLATTGDSVLDLKSFSAQAFDGKTFLPRERCWRCRLTFGFTWLWPEGNAKDLSVAQIKDFELRWDNTKDKIKDGEGKCAEYILWWDTIVKITRRSVPSFCSA